MGLSFCFFLVFLHFSTTNSKKLKDCPSWTVPQSAQQTIQFTTFNVDFLMNETYPITPWKTFDEASKHLFNIVGVVESISLSSPSPSFFPSPSLSSRPSSLSIIGLESVEDCSIVTQLSTKLTAYNYFPYVITNDTFQEQVGMISQSGVKNPLARTDFSQTYPIDGSRCGDFSVNDDDDDDDDEHTAFLGRHFYTYLDLNDDVPLLLFVVHLNGDETDLSDARSCHIREAEARIIIRKVNDLLRSHPFQQKTTIIIMGSFNDVDNNLNVPDTFFISKSRVFNWLIDELNLYNTGKKCVFENRYSYWAKEHATKENTLLLDSILISSHAIPAIIDTKVGNNFFGRNPNISHHWPVSMFLDMEKLRDIVNPQEKEKDKMKKDLIILISALSSIGFFMILFVLGIIGLIVLVLCCCVWNKSKGNRKKTGYLFLSDDVEVEKKRLEKSEKRITRKIENSPNTSKEKIGDNHFKVESFKII